MFALVLQSFIFNCYGSETSSKTSGIGASEITSITSQRTQTIKDGVTKALASKVIPSLNSDAGLTIIDADKNGVRDDVDALIKSMYTTETDLRVATQFAQAIQMNVSAPSPKPESIPTIAAAAEAAVDCAFDQMGPARSSTMMKEVRAATINTRDRFMAYRETQAALSGTHSSVPDNPKSSCK